MDDRSVPENIAALAQVVQAQSHRTAGPSVAQILMELVRGLTLFHSPDGQAYVSGLVSGHRETWAVPSKAFRLWLVRQFVKDQGKPPSAQALQDVLQVFEAQALDGPERPVFLRVGSAGGDLYFDLADDQRRVVVITPTDWRVVQDPRVHFIRPARSQALPIPVQSNGALDEFRALLNLAHAEDWQLLLAWLLGAIRPTGPYPVLVLQGEQGTAKSTIARILKYITDPSAVLLRTAPRDERDLLIAARHSHLLALDNLSGLTPWFSDALCRLATGGGFATRELYSDTEETILHAQRPVILNGIDDLATRQDLIDRAIVLTLPLIPETARRQEREVWEQVAALRPAVLGALLTATQHALATHDRVVLPVLPRMADFAVWVTAAEPALNWDSGALLNAYRQNRGEAIELGFEASPIAAHIRALVDSKPRWEGTAKELVEVIMNEKTEAEQRARTTPQTPQAMRSHLKRLAPALRAVGIEIIFGHRQARTGQRLITIEKRLEMFVTNVTPVIRPSEDGRCDGTEDDPTPQGDDGDTGDNEKRRFSGQGFPHEIGGMGTLRRDTLGRCAECDALTMFSYGGTRLCGSHARLRADNGRPSGYAAEQ